MNVDDVINAVEFKLDDISRTSEVRQELETLAGKQFAATTWEERNEPLMQALQVEKLVTTVTIGLIMLVAALNILTSLVMIVMEKNKDIAILKSMGAGTRQIRRIFVWQGLLIGLAGTVAGLILGHGLAWGVAAAGWGFLFLAPWIVLHGAHYLSAIADPISRPASNTSPTPITLVNILSTSRLFYGGTFAHYTGLVVAVLMCALAASRSLVGAGDRAMSISGMGTIAAVAATVTAYLVNIYLGGTYLWTVGTALRYFIPIIVAALPAFLCLAALHLRTVKTPHHVLVRVAPPIIVALIIVASFASDMAVRVRQAVNTGSILAFTKLATSENYLHYNQEVLYGPTRDKAGVQAVQ